MKGNTEFFDATSLMFKCIQDHNRSTTNEIFCIPIQQKPSVSVYSKQKVETQVLSAGL